MDSEASAKFKSFFEACRHALNRFWTFANKLTGNYLMYLSQALNNINKTGQKDPGSLAYWP